MCMYIRNINNKGSKHKEQKTKIKRDKSTVTAGSLNTSFSEIDKKKALDKKIENL